LSYYPSIELDTKIQDILSDEVQSIKNVTSLVPNIIFQPLYEAAIKAGKERGGNALGISADGPLTSEYFTQRLHMVTNKPKFFY
jgi:hypothetical protein